MSTNQHNLRENSSLWLIKIIAGFIVLVVIIVHMIVNHLVAPNGLLSYADVIAYYNNPVIPAMEIIFLVVVITHAFIGLRSIILDMNPSHGVIRWVNRLLFSVGLLAILYGSWLALTIASR